MPRCRDGSWCIDDLCHMVDQTLCGVWVETERNAEGDWLGVADQDDFDEWDDEEEHSCRWCPHAKTGEGLG